MRSTLESASDEVLLPLFLDRALSTLARHLGGWRLWLEYCTSQGLAAGSPSMDELLDFTVSLVEGCRSNRGHGRRRSAVSCLSALAFAAFKFQLTVLAAGLSSPLIQAWKAHGKWSLPPVKEAIPLPLPVLRRLESVTFA